MAKRGNADGGVVFAYLSGTPTHRRDFAQAVPALASVLGAHADARLLLVGHIEPPDALAPFASRIEHRPLVPWQELPGILAGVDVNLAPLETGNAFTACKSSIKYLEAALVGVPTVATPLPDFQRVIEDGRNGLLATADDEWRRALEHSQARRSGATRSAPRRSPRPVPRRPPRAAAARSLRRCGRRRASRDRTAR